MDTDEAKKKIQQETTNLLNADEQLTASFNRTMMDIQVMLDTLIIPFQLFA